MKIGLVAPPWVPVPPRGYGGTESVVDTLARGLQDAGHEVMLFTTGDATCPVPRRSVFGVPPEPMGSANFELRQVQAAYEEFAGVDVLHDHTVVGPVWAAANRVRTPVVVTVHNAFTPTNRALYDSLARWASVNCISHDQRASAPEIPVAAVIHHGLDLGHYAEGRGSGGYALALGRLAPEKGIREAIEIARRAGLPLRIAAKMRESGELRYFRECVEPLLGPDIVFLGEIGPEERNRELAGAVALINPIRWREPFGLAMIESMACGTPVIAFPHGAAPEIVRHGVTGFLCADVSEAAEALRGISTLDRSGCRAHVEERFSGSRMVADYLELYRQVLDVGRPLEQAAGAA